MSFDVARSISSLQEMTRDQVSAWLQLPHQVADGYAYLEQGEHWQNPADAHEMAFDSYPIPCRWERILRERCPVQTRFMTGVWRTRRGPAGP